MSWRARLSIATRGLRFFGTPGNPGSAGLFRFLEKQYPDLKKLNPCLQMLIREPGEGKKALIVARYEWGEVETREVENLSETEIEEKLKELVLHGETLMVGTPRTLEGRRFLLDDVVSYRMRNKVPLVEKMD